MTQAEALDKLIAAVEAGTSMNYDFADAFPVTGPSKPYWMGTSAYNNGSLDAAKALHEALLPGWDRQITTYDDDTFEASVSKPLEVKTYDGVSSCMARAWLIAILKAYRANHTQPT